MALNSYVYYIIPVDKLQVKLQYNAFGGYKKNTLGILTSVMLICIRKA